MDVSTGLARKKKTRRWYKWGNGSNAGVVLVAPFPSGRQHIAVIAESAAGKAHTRCHVSRWSSSCAENFNSVVGPMSGRIAGREMQRKNVS
jgi:hypothetical protein